MPWRYHPANPPSSIMPMWLREFNPPHPPRTHPTPRSRSSFALRYWRAPTERQTKCTSRYIILVLRNLGTRTRSGPSGRRHVCQSLCLVSHVLFEPCCRAHRTSHLVCNEYYVVVVDNVLRTPSPPSAGLQVGLVCKSHVQYVPGYPPPSI